MKNKNSDFVRLGDHLQLQLLLKDGKFCGIGEVRLGAVPLRSPRLPILPEIRTPDAVRITEFPLQSLKVDGDRITVDCGLRGQGDGWMEYMVHEVRPRYRAGAWGQPPAELPGGSLRTEIRAVDRQFGGVAFHGLSYQYDYNCESHPIYRLLDRATWEPGGDTAGCEFWMRNCFAKSIMAFDDPEPGYSTEWYLRSALNPNIFQFLPLQTELQGFTFTCTPLGILVTWATEVAHIRSLFEKPRGGREMFHWHEHCTDLAPKLTTSPVEVLWAEGKFDRIERANLYEAVREHVHQTLHDQIGMRRERITTYGKIEQWTLPDMDDYRTRGLPKLLDAGMKTIYVANHFQNNMNVWGVSNMCCTVDYRIAESVGEDRFQRFCRTARDAGANVEMWGNTSISTLTLMLGRRNESGDGEDSDGRANGPAEADSVPIPPIPLPFRKDSILRILREAAAPFVRNASGAIEADHYTPVFAVLNLRDPTVRAYWLARWSEAHRQFQLNGIFLDSSCNLSSDKFHYAQNTEYHLCGATSDQAEHLGAARPAQEPPGAILSQYRAHLDLMVEMQRLGYHYCSEDLGVFGTHRHGPSVDQRLDNLFLWNDCHCSFDAAAIRATGADPDDIFFRGLAYRMMWSVHWDPVSDRLSFHHARWQDEDDTVQPHHIRLFKAFNLVADQMQQRTILPEEKGVLYRSCDGTMVLWAFDAVTLHLPAGMSIRDLTTGEQFTDKSLRGAPHHLYCAQPCPDAMGQEAPPQRILQTIGTI